MKNGAAHQKVYRPAQADEDAEDYGFFFMAPFMAPLASSIFFMAVSVFFIAVSIFMAAVAESAGFAMVSGAIAGAGAGAIAGAAVSALGVSFALQAATSTTATRARRFMCIS